MIASLLTAGISLIVAPVPKPAHFGSWTVACDNVRHCEAIGLPNENNGDKVWTIHLSRTAAAEARPVLDAAPAFESGYQSAVRLRIDGRDTRFHVDGDGRAVGDPSAILAAVAAARKVELVDGKEKIVGLLPVTGASAALRWIDDHQKRTGTVTAVVARGVRPASEVPAPPILPRIALPPVSNKPPRKLSAADQRAIRRAGDCELDVTETAMHRLDFRHTVGIIGCIMGAYQGSSLVVIIDEAGRWSPAPIEQPEPLPKDADHYDSYFLTEADYSEKDRLLYMHAKGRGLADCGEAASWAWDGHMFRLASFQALDECEGAPPGTWLSRWQTANDPLKD